MFLIIKLAIFVYFFPLTSTLLWSVSLWGPHSSSADTYRERRVESSDLASAFVASSTGIAKKAHCPLSTSPAQNPQNQHNGPPDKVGGNKQRGEEQWIGEWRDEIDKIIPYLVYIFHCHVY